MCTYIFISNGATHYFICVFLGKMFSILGQVFKTVFESLPGTIREVK